jgi:transposase
MEKSVPELFGVISPEEWAQVPASVSSLIEELVRRMARLEQEMLELRAENERLREQIGRTSANSSQPPSQDPLNFKPNRKGSSGKKRGGQPGHEGHKRSLYPLELCADVIDHRPKHCRRCGQAVVVGENAVAYRHQVVEIPATRPTVIEHQFYSAICSCCGTETQAAEMSELVSKSPYGPRAAAYVGLLDLLGYSRENR